MDRPCMLLVGEEPDCALAIAKRLRPYFHVILASDCEAALAIVDEGHELDLLVTDFDGGLAHAIELLTGLFRRGHALYRHAIAYTRDPARATEQLTDRGLHATVIDKAQGLRRLRETALALRGGCA